MPKEDYQQEIFAKKAALAALQEERARSMKDVLTAGERADAGAKAAAALKVVDTAEKIAKVKGEIVLLEEKLYEIKKAGRKDYSALCAKAPEEKATILILTANAVTTERLALDEEVRDITDRVTKSAGRDKMEIFSRWAVRPLDILQAINEIQPEIVHFSGHGTADGKLLFAGEDGQAKPVSKETMVSAITAASEKARLFFFNACFSAAEAKAIVADIEAAIGMRTEIGDAAARVFAAQFYSALGFGKSVKAAFAQAKAALLLEGIAEEDTPLLYVKEGLDPGDIVLVK